MSKNRELDGGAHSREVADCPVGDPADCPIPRERRVDDPWRNSVTERMDAFERRLAENTTLTQAIKANTDEIVEFFLAGKGFFTVVRSVGTVAKWIATIAAGLGIAYGVVKFGIGQILADMGVTKR